MSNDLSSRYPSGLKAFECEVSVLGSPEIHFLFSHVKTARDPINITSIFQ